MSSIDLMDFERRTVLAIDRRHLDDQIVDALDRLDGRVLAPFRLSDCGEFVRAMMRRFNSAIYRCKTASRKERSDCFRDAQKAGSVLSNAVYRMQWRLENEGPEA